MATPDRTTVTIPRARFAQLTAIAERRQLPSVAALLDDFIRESIAAGEIPDRICGYGIVHDEKAVQVTIAGRTLPELDYKGAYLLSHALDAAAPMSRNGAEPIEGPLALRPGSSVGVDLGSADLSVGRSGRGVKLTLTDKQTSETETFVAPANLVAEVTRLIRGAVGNVLR